MALPSTLKLFNLFNDGKSYLGEVLEVNLPKLARKVEPYRAGGMMGPINLDMGQEALEMEWTCAGVIPEILGQYAHPQHDGVQLRFTGAYQKGNTAEVDTVEIDVRGRHQSIEQSAAKPGEIATMKVTTSLSYYKLTRNGTEEIEMDLVNGVEKVHGEDRLQALRQAIGL